MCWQCTQLKAGPRAYAPTSMFLGCPSVSACVRLSVQACVLLEQYLTNQWTEFAELFDYAVGLYSMYCASKLPDTIPLQWSSDCNLVFKELFICRSLFSLSVFFLALLCWCLGVNNFTYKIARQTKKFCKLRFHEQIVQNIICLFVLTVSVKILASKFLVVVECGYDNETLLRSIFWTHCTVADK